MNRSVLFDRDKSTNSTGLTNLLLIPLDETPETERGNKESDTKPTLRQSTSSKYFLTESNSEGKKM